MHPVRGQGSNAAHPNRLYSDLIRDGLVDKEGGLSPTSVWRIHAILRKSFDDAVRWGHVQRNVAQPVEDTSARALPIRDAS